jgi:hypothetical protein
MKWLIIQSAGQHNGSDGWCRNDYLRECFALQHGILQNGHECDVWGKRHESFNKTPDFNSYDFIVLLENYEWDWVPDLSQYTKPIKLHWIIDLHCQNPYVKWSQQCDIVLNSTKSLVENYERQCPNQKHIWFPNAVDDRYFKPRDLPKKHDIIFVGSPHNRIGIANQIGAKHFFKTGEDMLNIISETKIHFNKSIAQDVNYRCFETIGLGTCLLTNYIPEMEELGFKDGENCIFYNPRDINSCIERVRDILNSDTWKQVGIAGYNLSKENTYTTRIDKLTKSF